MNNRQLPALEVNLDAIKANAKTLCDICGNFGISVAGVIKFSDGDLQMCADRGYSPDDVWAEVKSFMDAGLTT
jgi:hypothetical protein